MINYRGSIYKSITTKLKWKFGSKKEFLEDLKDYYENCITDCDEIIEKLRFYRGDKERTKDSFTSFGLSISVASLDSKVSEADSLVSDPYNTYRKNNPIESHFWRLRKDEINDQLRFVKNLRSDIVDAKNEVEKCLDIYEKEIKREKASKQRDKSYEIDEEEIFPDSLPSEIRTQLVEKVQDEFSESDTEDDSEDNGFINSLTSTLKRDNSEDDSEDKDTYDNMMTPEQLTHFIILRMKKYREEQYDIEWHNNIKNGHTEQAKDIIEVMDEYLITDIDLLLRRLENDIDDFYIREVEKEYIKDVLSSDIPHEKITLNKYKNDQKY